MSFASNNLFIDMAIIPARLTNRFTVFIVLARNIFIVHKQKVFLTDARVVNDTAQLQRQRDTACR